MRSPRLVSILPLFVIHITSFSQITQPASVTTHVIKKNGVTDISSVNGLLSNEKVTIEKYFDGFGRPLEEVVVGGSPSGKDMMKFFKYDDLGRQSTAYLPYQRTTISGEYLNTGSAITEQNSFYTTNTTANKIANDAAPFAQTAFESSPLQRVLKQGNIGTNFQLNTTHYKEVVYRAGLATDNVRKWDETGFSNSTYIDYELSAVEGIDENGIKTIVFTDRIGRTILKRQQADETVGGISYPCFDTYFIYNNAGNIAYVIPPKAVAKFLSTSTWNQSGVPELIFSYKYDSRNRLTEKKVPGAAVVYMVYDPLDRLILVQDGQMRQASSSYIWFYTKYDNSNRAVSEGIYTYGSIISQADMQDYVNSQNFTTYYYETRTASTYGYSNNVFPTANITDLVYYYYDDYDFDNNGTADYSYLTQGLTGENTPASLVNGLSTGIRKRILGTTTWLISATFYNNRFVPIQIRSNNQLNSTVADHTTNVVDFAGRVTESKEYKNVSSATIAASKKLTYDKMDRLLTVKQSNNLNNNQGPEIIVASYEYNPLGQLVDKKLNSTNQGSTYLQSVDLRYTIKGQLRSINNSTLTNDGVLNDETNDVFGMELLYDQTDASLGNSPNYRGLLSAVKWKTVSPSPNTEERSYQFSYDKLYRMTGATYKAKSGSNWTLYNGGYNETATYDQAGNILTMQRNSVIGGSVTQIDNLTYSYSGSNDNHQLANVTESSSNSYGFKNITGSGTGYSYDLNGYLTADPKKGITIEYNELRKVRKVTKTTSNPNPYVEYRYDAVGIRISKWTYTGSGSIYKQEYIGGYVFDATTSATLLYFGMAEGRVRNEGGTLKFEYMIVDHQGNVRVSFEDNGSGSAVLKQENSYYPYGMIATSYVPTNPNKNLYNAGSEWQDELGGSIDFYSTFFREYDPALGRFNGVDPAADATFELSVYHYAGNNPINFNDPMGNLVKAELDNIINRLMSYEHGGMWSSQTPNIIYVFANEEVAASFADGIAAGGGGGRNPLQPVLDAVNNLIRNGLVVDQISFATHKSDWGVSISFSDPIGSLDPNGKGAGWQFVKLAEMSDAGLSNNMIDYLDKLGTLIESVTLTFDMLRSGMIGAQKLAITFGKTANEIVDIGKYKFLKFGNFGKLTLEGASKIAGGVTVVLTIVDMKQKGINWDNGTDFVFGVVTFIPGAGPVISGIYFVSNLIVKDLTGKSIGEWIGEGYKAGEKVVKDQWNGITNGINQLNYPEGWYRFFRY